MCLVDKTELEESSAPLGAGRTAVRRHHLLQFGNGNADLEDMETINILAWVVRHFVGLVVERPRTFWHSMHVNRSIDDYITASDMAFALLLLEHHMMEWRSQIQWTLETGKDGSLISRRGRGCHLLYKGGVAGEEAKNRFHQLNAYFHASFYDRTCPKKQQNLSRLRDCLKQMVEADRERVESNIENHDRLLPKKTPMKDLQDDILHRVFYYMNS